LLARLLAKEITANAPQPLIVENHAGAGGNIGAALVARAVPDGHTLLVGTVGTQCINKWINPQLTFDPEKDFVAITMLAAVANVMVMAAKRARELGVQTAADFIRYAKAHPGVLNMASSGKGTTVHLAGELFMERAGVSMVHVPFNGSRPALLSLEQGEVDVIFETISTALPFIRDGRFVALGVTSRQRQELLADVPTIEQAAGLPGFEVNSWSGLFAPRATPRDVIDAIWAQTNAAMRTATVLKALQFSGATAHVTPPEEFSEYVRAEDAKWRSIAKSLAIKS
jgi:tripartite-type tricarboxylate transporter receptor subunit TctC